MDSAEVICDPEFDAWDTLLAKNLDWRHSVSSLFDAQQSLRAVVTKCAYQYTRELFDSDLSMHDGPLLLTGHQPRVYHPGILVKNTLLERFAKRHKGLGINVIIDTDTGDGGHFYFPQYTNGQISLGQASFAAPGAETYGAQ
ncbi:MAG: hypothetical protein KDD62_05420, partial [Bdellovibrionales bacterium]|nr:hypothetical protein [Bdellovibrionales bacterium]